MQSGIEEIDIDRLTEETTALKRVPGGLMLRLTPTERGLEAQETRRKPSWKGKLIPQCEARLPLVEDDRFRCGK